MERFKGFFHNCTDNIEMYLHSNMERFKGGAKTPTREPQGNLHSNMERFKGTVSSIKVNGVR